MMVRRDALDGNHPEHTYNWILRTFEGLVDPEDFGIRKPPFLRRHGDWTPSPFDPEYQ